MNVTREHRGDGCEKTFWWSLFGRCYVVYLPRASTPFSFIFSFSRLWIPKSQARLMSGKAPPKGPRALLGTQAASSSSSSSASPLNSLPQNTARPTSAKSSSATGGGPSYLGTRIGAIPPTGPRSLQGNNQSKPPPQAPKSLVNGDLLHTNSVSSSHVLQSNRHPISINSKKKDAAPVCVFVVTILQFD